MTLGSNLKNLYWYEVEQVQAHPDMDEYKAFASIPEELVSESSLVSWLTSGGKLEEIPGELRSEIILHVAARHDRDALELIQPWDVTDYHSLAVDAIKNASHQVRWVAPEYMTERFLIDVALNSPQAMESFGLGEENKHLVTENVLATLCSSTISHSAILLRVVGGSIKEMIKDEFVREAIKTQVSDYTSLATIGKEHVLVDMIKDGFWPEAKNFTHPDKIQHFSNPPAGPADALERLYATKSPGYHVLHKAWLKTQPQSEVISELQSSSRGLDVLFDIFPERLLQQNMREHRGLRGRVLERDMGL